ncbi:MAG: hypothetical protein NVSMB55_12990 [Mycobacteriales bacterium]
MTSSINNVTTTTAGAAPKRRAGRAHRGRRAWFLGVVAVLALVLVLLLDQAVAAWAAGGGIDDVKSFAAKLTNYVTALAASIAVLFLAISGIRWTMSGGNPMRQTEARNGLVSAAAGLAIALSANVIVSLVVAALK